MTAYRKLTPADSQEILHHLLRLDPLDRRCRFHAAASDESVADHVKKLDWMRAHMIGSFQGGKLRGLAELAFERLWMPRGAELAVTVEAPWRQRGVATQLVRRAAELARNRGITTLTMLCLTENQPMRRIASQLSGKLLLEDGQIVGQVGLPDPTPISVMMEAMERACDRFEAFADDWLASDAAASDAAASDAAASDAAE
jgi:GNAT superfamily N-acetyltransferase